MQASLELMRESLQYRRSVIDRSAKARAIGQALGGVREGFSRDEQREVDEIDAALKRIQSGSYGHCERCGHAIGWQRLRSMPETPHCRECSE